MHRAKKYRYKKYDTKNNCQDVFFYFFSGTCRSDFESYLQQFLQLKIKMNYAMSYLKIIVVFL